MADQKTKVTLSPGVVKTGTLVGIEESTERWSDIKLADGSLIRIRQVVVQVVRVDDEYDSQGNPLYVVQSAPIMAIASVPPDLTRSESH